MSNSYKKAACSERQINENLLNYEIFRSEYSAHILLSFLTEDVDTSIHSYNSYKFIARLTTNIRILTKAKRKLSSPDLLMT
jgi:hypothetical protein